MPETFCTQLPVKHVTVSETLPVTKICMGTFAREKSLTGKENTGKLHVELVDPVLN